MLYILLLNLLCVIIGIYIYIYIYGNKALSDSDIYKCKHTIHTRIYIYIYKISAHTFQHKSMTSEQFVQKWPDETSPSVPLMLWVLNALRWLLLNFRNIKFFSTTFRLLDFLKYDFTLPESLETFTYKCNWLSFHTVLIIRFDDSIQNNVFFS